MIYKSETDEYPEKALFTGKYNSDEVIDWYKNKCEIIDAVLLK